MYRLPEGLGGARSLKSVTAILLAAALLPRAAIAQQQHADLHFRPRTRRAAYDALGVLKEADIEALAHGGTVPGMHIGGRAQAVAWRFGRGHIVVAGEAAMFSAQILPSGDGVGLNSDDDQQFVLNLIHWLSRLI